MGRTATRTQENSELMSVYASKKLKIAIKMVAAENGKGMADYASEILAAHPEIKKMLKKIS